MGTVLIDMGTVLMSIPKDSGKTKTCRHGDGSHVCTQRQQQRQQNRPQCLCLNDSQKKSRCISYHRQEI
ncbi:MAG: hypothetical protein Q7J78_05955 [Clostridiales bacterium]|nr:hypothetical protein [Clostridiales bacterium]